MCLQMLHTCPTVQSLPGRCYIMSHYEIIISMTVNKDVLIQISHVNRTKQAAPLQKHSD